jgi:hypothetical protein
MLARASESDETVAKPTDTCADGRSSPSGLPSVKMNLLLSLTIASLATGRMARRHRAFGKCLSHPTCGEPCFATAPRHSPGCSHVDERLEAYAEQASQTAAILRQTSRANLCYFPASTEGAISYSLGAGAIVARLQDAMAHLATHAAR